MHCKTYFLNYYMESNKPIKKVSQKGEHSRAKHKSVKATKTLCSSYNMFFGGRKKEIFRKIEKLHKQPWKLHAEAGKYCTHLCAATNAQHIESLTEQQERRLKNCQIL